MNRAGSRRTGFTFLGLLIILALLGALAGGWIVLRPPGERAPDGVAALSFAENRAAAERMVSAMRGVKQAAVLYHNDYGFWPEWVYDPGSGAYRNLSPRGEGILPGTYLDGIPASDTYAVEVLTGRDSSGKERAFVVLRDYGLAKEVKEVLASKAGVMGFRATQGSGFDFTELQVFTGSEDNLVWPVTGF